MASKEGWLSKESRKTKIWKKRWFVLKSSQMYYYESPQTNLINTIDLTHLSEIKFDNSEPNLFEINIQNGKNYRLKSETQEEFSSWIELLKQVNPLTSIHRYSIENFEKIENLGKGTFGKVTLVRSKESGKLYAMKTMNKKMLEDYDQIEATILERNILFEIDHPFIVSAHYSFQSQEGVHLILDYVSGGNMLERIREEDYFNEERARLYSAEVALAIGYLHKLGYIYRDMKSDNILIDYDGHIKITDFGLIKGSMFRPNDTTSTFCGTVDYIAPESILEKPYTKDIDWWGFGILVYEMLVGQTPFFNENQMEIYRAIISNEPHFPPFVSEKARNFVSKLLQKNPSKRLGFGINDIDDIKKDPFFDGLNWDDVINKKIEPQWIPNNKSANLELKRDISSFDQSEMANEKTQLAFKGFSQVNLLKMSPMKV